MTPQIPGYKIERIIAKGGMGKVYLADFIKRQRKVAIKVYQPESPTSRLADAFLHEANVLAKTQSY